MSEEQQAGGGAARTVLNVDGERIALNRFAQEMLSGGVLGMIKALRGVEDPHKIVIEIDSD